LRCRLAQSQQRKQVKFAPQKWPVSWAHAPLITGELTTDYCLPAPRSQGEGQAGFLRSGAKEYCKELCVKAEGESRDRINRINRMERVRQVQG